ncbi:NADH:ubiquinone reductase (Na(+)-transporting) subunit F [Alkaliphilus peptidifermentans]|uniref:Na+-transporting NADH:ubiquinone oxidoreductase subunit F n=1 Tax=Alkaliphilus peptidifermentans DSM 18978 TaxID=1120976 RepID=A0A1G5CJC6_9FIRM|nr:2Fe-2S iron-sulfur cluster binding domain-containing protein [Alkaliphilus peptidifermentans]SCY02513.1 Na+-transporting NADH:ubiquinone oxidoreductase subunit F [Alkaliphilus peptidifermentans DSM 18978]
MINILVTIGVISGLSTILALLLTIADVYIADYGEKKIIINGEKELIVDGGNTLLSSLVGSSIFIPSACGGKGSCGYCKCKINNGAGPVLATELSYLTDEDQKNNVRLSCQVKVKEDMEIEIPEELFNVKQFRAIVEEAQDLTDKIKFLRFKIIDGQEISFKAGQYVQLIAPAYPGNKEEVYRAYSIASSTKHQDYIDLIIGYVEGGILTTYVHKHLSKGDEVSFNGPYGDFYLQNTDAEMVMVAVGTGMAPIRSILYEMLDKGINRRAVYFFGARSKDDLFMLDEMKMLEENLYDFKFIPTLSRPQEEDDWEGAKGRVTDAIAEYLDEAPNREAYLCGSAPMIDSTVKSLLTKGFSEDRIFYDKFE